jgi:hypothetical protein
MKADRRDAKRRAKRKMRVSGNSYKRMLNEIGIKRKEQS